MKALRAVEPLKIELRVVTVQQLMTPAQLAEYLQIEVNTLYVWVSRRRIPYRKIGHLLRFDLDEIKDWTATPRKGSGTAGKSR
jgi:excisionase family DNA binding protein